MKATPMTLHRPLAAAATVLALSMTGCGGGGGDSGGSAVTVPTTPVAITSANQDSVSRAAAAAAQGGFASGTVPLAAGRAHALAATRAGASNRSLAAVFAPLALRALRSPAVAGRATISSVIDPGPDACIVSGTSHATLDDRDNSGGASIGDVVSVTFSNCEDFAGEKVNGTLSLSVSQVTPGTLLSFTAGATMAALSVSASGHSVTYDGDMTMNYAESSASVSTVQVTVGSQLAVRIVTPNFSDTIALLSGYRITSTSDSSALPPGGSVPGKSTTTVAGEVASTLAGGKVTVSTLVPVVEYDVDDVPVSGQLRATGTGSSVTLTALTGGQVRIDRDDGNDGSIDATKTVDWAFLF